MKLNGWLQIVVLLIGMMGLVSWVITADARLHDRCHRLENKVDKNMDTVIENANIVTRNYIEVIELRSDVALIREILELRYPETTKQAKKNNLTK